MPVTTDEWRAAGRTHAWRGMRVFYRDEGAGEPLVLLHGFPTSSWDWAPVWSALVARYRVIAPDYIGFGFSDKPTVGPYSIFAYADQVESLLDCLGVGATHVLAHDLGDTVAQELLARDHDRAQDRAPRPRRYLSAAFLNGGIIPELHRARPSQKLLASPLGFAVARAINRRIFERGLAEVFGPDTQPSRAELDGFWACASFGDGTRNFHRIIEYIAERRIHRARWVGPILDGVTPTCFINGHRDPVSGAHVVARLRELWPGAQIHDLPTIGHYPQVEAPDAVLRAYEAFRAGIR